MSEHSNLGVGIPRTWIALTLQGGEVVFEQTIEPPKDDGSEAMRRIRADNPDFFRTRHYTYSEYELHLTTDDQDKVKKSVQPRMHGEAKPILGPLAVSLNWQSPSHRPSQRHR
jgi:uncharacterized protein (DUF2461 family)